MKKFIFTSALVASLAFGTSVSANSDIGEVAGTTPEQSMYTLDLFLEDLKLAITFDNEEEAQLLLQYAQERLAEAKVMTEEEQTKFLSEAIEGYTDLLEKAEDAVSEVITDQDTSDAVKDELINELEETVTVDDDVTGQLEEDQAQEVEQKTDEAYLVANVVKGYDVEAVKDLRSQEFGYGEIAKILSLSEVSGKSVEEIVAMLDGKDFGEVYKELSITVAQVKEAALTTKLANLEESLTAARESGDEKTVHKLEKKIEVLLKKKDGLANKEKTTELTDDDTIIEEKPVVTEAAPATMVSTVVESTEVPVESTSSTKASPSATAVTKSIVGKEHSVLGKAKAAEKQVKIQEDKKPEQQKKAQETMKSEQPSNSLETRKPQEPVNPQEAKNQEKQATLPSEKGNSDSKEKGNK